MELFVLKNSKGKLLRDSTGVEGFDNKRIAKHVCNELNDELGRIEWRVTYGKDHRKYKGGRT